MATGNVPIFYRPVTNTPPKLLVAIEPEDTPNQALEKFKRWCKSDEKDRVVQMQFSRLDGNNEPQMRDARKYLKKYREKLYNQLLQELSSENH